MKTGEQSTGRELRFSKLEIGDKIVINDKEEQITSKRRSYLTTAVRRTKDIILEIYYQVTQSDDRASKFLTPFAFATIWLGDAKYSELNKQLGVKA